MKTLILITLAFWFVGCAATKSKTYHLLYEEQNLAYKSVTKEDYENKEEC